MDPISIGGAAGRPGAEMFKEATKSLQNASEQVSKFEDLRSKMESQDMSKVKGMDPNQAFQIQHQESPQNVQNVQNTQKVDQVNQSQKVGQEIPKVTDMKSLQQVVDRLKAGQSRLKDLIDNATSGKTFSPQELIGLQAEVSQITTEMQLCSKVVEQGVGSLKQTMQMQV
ncbi:MAG TPA: hypothetical protein VLR94_03175 [Acidobacteriota bacterium]|nr:hypothetical protein [Acidobacteriota bacterium]